MKRSVKQKKISSMIMNGAWMKYGSFESQFCVGNIYVKNKLQMKLKGTAKSSFNFNCAAPPDLRQSYSGSAMPCPNAEFAFGHGAQSGAVKTDDGGNFSFKLIQPNSYYQNNELIPPTVYISSGSDRIAVVVGTPVANRSLHSLPNRPNRSSGR